MTVGRAYLDHNATTPLRPEAQAAMIGAMTVTGNPSSVHAEGRAARHIVESARADVAALAGCEPSAVVFTSGATEAASTVMRAGWGEIVTSAAEHPAVAAAIAASGVPTVVVPLSRDGGVELRAVEAALGAPLPVSARRLLVVQAANGETGTIQPVADLARLAHAHGALMFTDAAQAAGKLDLPACVGEADYVALSAHKLGGPQGIGALVVRGPQALPPLLVGGGQERGRRAGTEAVTMIAGFAAAVGAVRGQAAERVRLRALRDEVEGIVTTAGGGARVVAAGAKRLPNTVSVICPGRRSETLVIALDLAGVAVSAGSACSSGKVRRSGVLEAMGYGPDEAASAIRISLGWSTTRADIERLRAAWAAIDPGDARLRNVA
ncbi:MAG: cysteine desulfurase family protein [Hyphomicrobiaceae bacterium]|nr:cysteine desulfurase family protein [Hyphomicrobiaceae bacterium]